MSKLFTPFLVLLLVAGCQVSPVAETAPTTASNDGFYDRLFDESFFARSLDPFQEIHRISQVLKSADEQRPAPPGFLGWYFDRFGRFPAEWIFMEQDADTVSYKLKVDLAETAEINIRVLDGMLHLTGELRVESGYNKRTRRLDQKLPLPVNTQADSVFALKFGEYIVISLDKASPVSPADPAPAY